MGVESVEEKKQISVLEAEASPRNRSESERLVRDHLCSSRSQDNRWRGS